MAIKIDREIYLLSPTAKAGVIHMPMITFDTTAKQIDFSSCDTLMFSSKQAVKSAEEIDSRWKKFPSIAIGDATKKEIEAFGGKVLYAPSAFYAKELAEDIVESLSGRKILYLRPQKISFDSKSFLALRGIALQEQIIYETSCVSYVCDEAPDKHAIIIFTSPSSIYCFLKNFDWDKSYTAVVIGNETKSHLPQYIQYVTADQPLIEDCIAKAKKL
ncbi:MAG: uroporphyrinogen-III synthase [Sulfurovum sp.]|nr:uroporphyrinogen-III synthase [Sulfurovum sp.]